MIAVGGTFNHLHEGHKALLDRARFLSAKYGENIVVGVMSDQYLWNKYPDVPRRFLHSWEERCMTIRDHIGKNVTFQKVDDPSYIPPEDLFTILVVSEETLPNAARLIGDRNILLSVVPMVRREDGTEIHTKDFILSNMP